MARPTIAAVIPAHPGRIANGKLQRAIASVLGQQLLPDQICIAVDHDGEGAAKTRGRALAMAQTDRVAFLDSDDVWLPMHLRALSAHMDKTGADVVYSWFKIMQEFPGQESTILEDDPIFPMSHYLDEFDPEHPIETTITTMARTELAQAVGMHALDRGEVNSGEDRAFIMGCLERGAVIKHLRRKTWLWSHHWIKAPTPGKNDGIMGNTSGLPTRGDAVDR